MTARQPTNVLAFKGTFAKDPARGRARAGEPQPRERLADNPPDYLPLEVAAVWRQVMAVVPLDVLGDSDVLAVEIVARLTAKMRADGETDWAQLRIALCELGMTPASRSKVKVTDFDDAADRKPGEKTGNAFADLKNS